MEKSENSKSERHGFGMKQEITPVLAQTYRSELVEKIKTNRYEWEIGRVRFRLAKEFGFCPGVDRAVDLAYETRAKFPEKRIFITNEIIHNPTVNRKLIEMGIRFLKGPYQGETGIEDIRKDDAVLIPAFGMTLEELKHLNEKGCLLVDTTCGSVIAVWKRVEQYARDGFTAVIHGKYDHEETRATCSRAGRYVVVWDKKEAECLCGYILRGGPREDFFGMFRDRSSEGFDPDRDLLRVGCANQTTMLSRESIEIANSIRNVMIAKYGEAELAKHFRHFDTICSSTQDRQDAVQKLLSEARPDFAVVIGGYNSSNTTHLLEICLTEGVKAYHVKDAGCFRSGEEIEHKPLGAQTPVLERGWLSEGKITVGITAGASTPDRLIEEVILKISQIANGA
ncbi:MAG TPA: 4-hydroxy-3-methylbut-2-enyl diphosphate reductase [Candidatus Omnitrophota bacterium]|nr:4-hydroxy-3-methylbut-2-enyl diphosphate reductase [Candidatus Omnitrophota bacterium]